MFEHLFSDEDVGEDCASLRRQILAGESGSLEKSPMSSVYPTSILGDRVRRERGYRERKRRGREGEGAYPCVIY